MQSGMVTLEESLAVFYKAKQYYHTIQQSYSYIFTQMIENYSPHKNLHRMFTEVWFFFIIAKNWSNPDALQQVNGWIFISLYKGIFSTNSKKNELPSHTNTWMSLKCI